MFLIQLFLKLDVNVTLYNSFTHVAEASIRDHVKGLEPQNATIYTKEGSLVQRASFELTKIMIFFF